MLRPYRFDVDPQTGEVLLWNLSFAIPQLVEIFTVDEACALRADIDAALAKVPPTLTNQEEGAEAARGR